MDYKQSRLDPLRCPYTSATTTEYSVSGASVVHDTAAARDACAPATRTAAGTKRERAACAPPCMRTIRTSFKKLESALKKTHQVRD